MNPNTLDLDPAAERVLDDYLEVLAERLPGPARARRAILAELGDGLVDATLARLADGLSPAQAAIAAVNEFGDPATVARAFAPELAATRARRIALALIATGPLVGSLWLGLLAASGPAVIALAPPWRWPITQAGGWPARLLLAVTVASVVTAWLTVAATGQLIRWLPTLPRLPAVMAGSAAAGASLLDATLLLVLATGALPTPDTAPWRLLVVVAALASLVRGTLATRAARRCLPPRPTPS